MVERRRSYYAFLFLMVLLLLSLIGCARASREEKALYLDGFTTGQAAPEEGRALAYATGPMPTPAPAVDSSVSSVSGEERMIVYTVQISLVVNDTQSAQSSVESLVKEFGGYVLNQQIWQENGAARGQMTVRVPAESLDQALERIRALAEHVESESISGNDVTEEYVDLQARLKNLQLTEQELQELLTSRKETGKTEDILEVYRELTQIRAQIEQIEGRMQYLSTLSAMATITINFIPSALAQPVTIAGWEPTGIAREAIRALVKTLQKLVEILIWLVLYVLPILLIIAVLLWLLFRVVRWIWRKLKKRSA